jgi:putative phosphoribosyl transferase
MTTRRREAEVPTRDHAALPGTLTVPDAPAGVVAFAHGSGSSRHSPRNRAVADLLVDAGFATLLFDLLDPAEAEDRANVFDIALLARRVVDAAAWLDTEPDTRGLPLGLFGASTGAAAALVAAADLGDRVGAVVSRGGRPDLAGGRLAAVHAPTLLVVGGDDHTVLELNRRARERLAGPTELIVVPHAGHLFEEAGALEEVAAAARAWLATHLRGADD